MSLHSVSWGSPRTGPLKVPRKRPSASFMMLALWMTVTFLRWLARAKAKANLMMRSDLARVMILSDSTTPGTLWCSRPLYSPSVFSRMMHMSTFLWRVWRPGMFLTRAIEA